MSVCDSAYSKESVFRIKLARFRRSNHGKKQRGGGLGGENGRLALTIYLQKINLKQSDKCRFCH